uniref:Uncharacterized protein n=1 Tax=Romanomermis culicivorax TaxID=13658 RepID=A0A915KV16_ROMCU
MLKKTTVELRYQGSLVQGGPKDASTRMNATCSDGYERALTHADAPDAYDPKSRCTHHFAFTRVKIEEKIMLLIDL